MSQKHSLGITAFIIISLIAVTYTQFIGPALIKIKIIKKCGEDAPGTTINVEMQKINRTHDGLDVYIGTDVTFGPEIQISATVAKWSDGGWKPHFLDVYEPDACLFFMKYAEDKFKAILKSLGRSDSCPVEKGIFDLKQYVYDGILSVPVMYGDFKIDMILEKNTKMVTCVQLIINSSPRKT